MYKEQSKPVGTTPVVDSLNSLNSDVVMIENCIDGAYSSSTINDYHYREHDEDDMSVNELCLANELSLANDDEIDDPVFEVIDNTNTTATNTSTTTNTTNTKEDFGSFSYG